MGGGGGGGVHMQGAHPLWTAVGKDSLSQKLQNVVSGIYIYVYML